MVADAGGIGIRRAEASDAAALAELTGHLGYPATTTQLERRLAAIAAEPRRLTLVAELDGRVVGYVGVAVTQGYEADAPHARVMAIVVEPEHRRRGIATALLVAAEGWSRDQGAAVIVLNSGEHRSDGHAFYERIGYANTGRRYRKALDRV